MILVDPFVFREDVCDFEEYSREYAVPGEDASAQDGLSEVHSCSVSSSVFSVVIPPLQEDLIEIYKGGMTDKGFTGVADEFFSDDMMKYRGSFTNNAYCGLGRLYNNTHFYANNNNSPIIYFGTFMNGTFHGSGSYYYNTYRYKGEFRNGDIWGPVSILVHKKLRQKLGLHKAQFFYTKNVLLNRNDSLSANPSVDDGSNWLQEEGDENYFVRYRGPVIRMRECIAMFDYQRLQELDLLSSSDSRRQSFRYDPSRGRSSFFVNDSSSTGYMPSPRASMSSEQASSVRPMEMRVVSGSDVGLSDSSVSENVQRVSESSGWIGNDGFEHFIGTDGFEYWVSEDGYDHFVGDDGFEYWIGEDGFDHFIGNDGFEYWIGENGFDHFIGDDGYEYWIGEDACDHFIGDDGYECFFDAAGVEHRTGILLRPELQSRRLELSTDMDVIAEEDEEEEEEIGATHEVEVYDSSSDTAELFIDSDEEERLQGDAPAGEGEARQGRTLREDEANDGMFQSARSRYHSHHSLTAHSLQGTASRGPPDSSLTAEGEGVGSVASTLERGGEVVRGSRTLRAHLPQHRSARGNAGSLHRPQAPLVSLSEAKPVEEGVKPVDEVDEIPLDEEVDEVDIPAGEAVKPVGEAATRLDEVVEEVESENRPDLPVVGDEVDEVDEVEVRADEGESIHPTSEVDENEIPLGAVDEAGEVKETPADLDDVIPLDEEVEANQVGDEVKPVGDEVDEVEVKPVNGGAVDQVDKTEKPDGDEVDEVDEKPVDEARMRYAGDEVDEVEDKPADSIVDEIPLDDEVATHLDDAIDEVEKPSEEVDDEKPAGDGIEEVGVKPVGDEVDEVDIPVGEAVRPIGEVATCLDEELDEVEGEDRTDLLVVGDEVDEVEGKSDSDEAHESERAESAAGVAGDTTTQGDEVDEVEEKPVGVQSTGSIDEVARAGDEVDEVEKPAGDEVDEVEKPVGDEVDEVEKPIGDEVDEVEKPVGDEVDEVEKPTGEEVDEVEKPTGDEVDEVEKPVGDEVDETTTPDPTRPTDILSDSTTHSHTSLLMPEPLAAEPPQLTPTALDNFDFFFVPHGEGEEYYASGKLRYKGHFSYGVYHQYGSLLMKNGDTYTGEFRYGVIDGKGRYFDKSKSLVYKGSFRNGKRNGYCEVFSARGFPVFKGNMVDNAMEGKGALYDPNCRGVMLEGQFHLGQLSGNDVRILYYDQLLYFGDIAQNWDVRRLSTVGKDACSFSRLWTAHTPAEQTLDEEGNRVTELYGSLLSQLAYVPNGQGSLFYVDITAVNESVRTKYRSNSIVSFASSHSSCDTLNSSAGVSVASTHQPLLYNGLFKNGRFDGMGTLFWNNDSNSPKYTGCFRNNEFEGDGVYMAPSGCQYSGHFVAGEKTGAVTVVNGAGRTVYEGEVDADNHFHGHGRVFFADGSMVEGVWHHGETTEKAVVLWQRPQFADSAVKWKQGVVWTSTFAETPSVKLRGSGVFTYPNGDTASVSFTNEGALKSNSVRVTSHEGYVVYEGEVNDEMRAEGFGTLYAQYEDQALPSDASCAIRSYAAFPFPLLVLPAESHSAFSRRERGVAEYTGDFVNGVPEGYGVVAFADAISIRGRWARGDLVEGSLFLHNHLVYTGAFREGKKEGQGQLFENDRVCYAGAFHEDEKEGKGKEWDESGNVVYEGDYELGQHHGVGVLYKENAKWIEGHFERDVPVGVMTEYDKWGHKVYQGPLKEFKYHGVGSLIRGSCRYEGVFREGALECDRVNLYQEVENEEVFVCSGSYHLVEGDGETIVVMDSELPERVDFEEERNASSERSGHSEDGEEHHSDC